jgi:protein-L-isoaspartate(D-aspartate) O-methyltransferase
VKDPYEESRLAMVLRDIQGRGISDTRVIEAMKKIPRHLFINSHLNHLAYSDKALPIDEDQTISQPYIVALMTQALRLRGREKVLEIGTGSGYQAAILAELTEKVFSIERIQKLAQSARKIIEGLGYHNVIVVTGDGTIGLTEFAPFDRIIITASAPEIPLKLVKQLKDGGIMVVPVGNRNVQKLKVVERVGEEMVITDSIDCVFVPLIGREGWKN